MLIVRCERSLILKCAEEEYVFSRAEKFVARSEAASHILWGERGLGRLLNCAERPGHPQQPPREQRRKSGTAGDAGFSTQGTCVSFVFDFEREARFGNVQDMFCMRKRD